MMTRVTCYAALVFALLQSPVLAQIRIMSGSPDNEIFFVAVDDADKFTRETGLNSWSVYYSLNGQTPVQMTSPTIREMSAVNMPGVYTLLVDEGNVVPLNNDTAELCFHITETGGNTVAPVTRTIEIYRPKISHRQTLTVDNTGTAGINWGNVANATATVSLPNTTVGTVTQVTNPVEVDTMAPNTISASVIADNAIDAAAVADDTIDSGAVVDGALLEAKFGADYFNRITTQVNLSLFATPVPYPATVPDGTPDSIAEILGRVYGIYSGRVTLNKDTGVKTFHDWAGLPIWQKTAVDDGTTYDEARAAP